MGLRIGWIMLFIEGAGMRMERMGERADGGERWGWEIGAESWVREVFGGCCL